MVEAGAAAQGRKSRHQGAYGEGFIVSIACAAGFDVLLPRQGDGMDLQVFTRGPNGTSGSGQIAFQVKSWSNGTLKADGHFHYPLKVSAYNALASANDVRHYLALCIVPKKTESYSDAHRPRLVLKYAAYWLSLRDMEPDESLNRDSTKVVLVPAINLITAATMRALVEKKEHLAVVL